MPTRALGNDLVDLSCSAGCAPTEKWRETKFLDRVFSVTEQELISESIEKDRTLWTLWAAKEASYKARRKSDPDLVFAPKQVFVDIASRRVAFGDLLRCPYEIEIEQAAEYVHVIAFRVGSRPTTIETRISRHDGNESLSVRNAAQECLRRLGFQRSEVLRPFVKGGFGPPYFKDYPELDLSLSHDGNRVAAVVSY